MAKPKRSKAEKEERKRRRRRKKADHQGTADSSAPSGVFGSETFAAFSGESLPAMPPEIAQMMRNMAQGDWSRFDAHDYSALARILRVFDLRSTIASVAGLLTVPEYQVGTIRLEVLIHLIATHTRGRKSAVANDVRQWVERTLAGLPVRRMEDPLEDVFVSNVIAPGGNYRVFEGIWESSDRALQAALDAFLKTEWGRGNMGLLEPVVALLRLSDAVAERAGIARWTIPQRTDPSDEFLGLELDLRVLSRRVTFTAQDLAALGVSREELTPFILPLESRSRVRNESLGHSTLERFPIISFGQELVLTLPTAVSPAARRYVVEKCSAEGHLAAFRRALRRADYREVVQEALHLVDAPRGVGKSALPPQTPPRPAGPVVWDEVHCPIDEDKIAQVILLHDTLDDVQESGLTTPRHIPELNDRLESHIEATTRHLAPHTSGGLVVITYGGIGRGLALGLPQLPTGWHPVVMSVANFVTFAWSPDASLLRLWKLQEELARLEASDVHFVETNGALNTYAYWTGQGFTVCPAEFPYPPTQPSMIQISTDFIRGFRVTERRVNDVHAALADGGSRVVRVRRLSRSAFFPAMRERPIYVADELARDGVLLGIYEHPELSVWVSSAAPATAPATREFVYQLWESVLSWLDRLIPELASLLSSDRPRLEAKVLSVRLRLSDESDWREFVRPNVPVAARPTATHNLATSTIIVTVPLGFLGLLMRPTNDGERALLEVVCEAILASLGVSDDGESGVELRGGVDEPPAIVREAVDRAMRGVDTRFLHMFQVGSPTDQVAALRPGRKWDPRFIFAEDTSIWEEGLAWSVVERDTLRLHRTPAPEGRNPPTQEAPSEATATAGSPPSSPGAAPSGPTMQPDEVRDLSGRATCTQALGALVDVVWGRIRSRLQEINGPSLVTRAIQNCEAIFGDREHWRRTARAVIALYGETDDVGRISAGRDGHRSAASNAARVLVEMAVCTCPRDSGRAISLADYDYLAAGVATLVHLASDSDAIHAGLAEPWLRIYPSGRIHADHSFVATIVNPFAVEVHSADLQFAAAAYAELYRPRSGGSLATVPDSEGNAATRAAKGQDAISSLFDAEFTNAFTAEFGITPDRMLDGLGELVDIGVREQALVVSTTRGALAARLVEARHFTRHEVAAFFDMLALVRHGDWGTTPKGFRARDWHPWRFRRRLSVVARPLATFGDDDGAPVIFGMYQLGASISYLFENIRSAWLPEEFFRSKEMISYRGRIADGEGAAFTQEAATVLRDLGWEARTEVRMSTVGAPAELGDVDIVAWRTGDDRLLLLECKRLQPARTIGEISELLRQFRGETGDRLGKHMRRYAWVVEHGRDIRVALGVPHHATSIVPALVTNRDVPMRFRTDLPLPPDRIIPLARLAEEFGRDSL